MPVRTAEYLIVANRHPRDSRIDFQEEGHLYTIDGKDTKYTSVTTLVHKYFANNFDPVAQAARQEAKNKSPGDKYYGMSADEIRAVWKKNADDASNLGSEMHQQIEVYLDHDEHGGEATMPDTVSKEFGMFLDYYRDHVKDKMIPYRSEWYVFDEKSRVCGSIDMVFRDAKEDVFYIVDWKRTRNLSPDGYGRYGSPPLSHMPHCNLSQYSLQLNTYRTILESQYGMKIAGLFLVVLHPDNDTYQITKVPIMVDEIQAIMFPKPIKHNTAYMFSNLNWDD